MSDVAVVTGTSTGMGLHAAVELARRGLVVVATMRDPGRDTALRAAASEAGVEVDVRALDVTDHVQGAAVLAAVEADHGSVDVLLSNAGAGWVGTTEELDLDGLRAQLELNYVAPVALTRAVLPGMRARGRGRVLTVTSVGGTVGQPFADAYCGAKFAVEGHMQSLAVLAERFGVWVSVVEPAAVASEFVTNVARPDVPEPYRDMFEEYVARTTAAFAAAQSAQDAGRSLADAATSSSYRFRWQTSPGATAFAGTSLADLDGERVLGVTRGWIG